MSYFKDTTAFIEGNQKLRGPQKDAYVKIRDYFSENPSGEALVVLPTGTGKSGLISIAPYGVSDGRVLIITPGLVTKDSVIEELQAIDDNFWLNQDILFDASNLPVLVEYHHDVLDGSLEQANFIITNAQKLQSRSERSILKRLPKDFFDMVIVDEAHHSVAQTWQDALSHFSPAKVLHVTGTPYRGDNQEIPGVEIHRTALSEVMRDRYVKYLRKETINSKNIVFEIPGQSDALSIDEVLQFKERDWIEKSIALSKDCSLEVIQRTKQSLMELRDSSPNVHHKILAVACGISHAEDLRKWYEETGLRATIVHSDLESDTRRKNMLRVANHDCDVVVSVNMLMEGYNHKFLTVLGIFRPFRSLNAFAQIIGRILRAIPENIITSHEIDNNGVIIYHQETGLDDLWETFRKEVEKSRFLQKDYPDDSSDFISDDDYQKREQVFGSVTSCQSFLSSTDSYLDDIDFHDLFRSAREAAEQKTDSMMSQMPDSVKEDPKLFEQIKNTIKGTNFSNSKKEAEQQFLGKRPELARKQYRETLKNTAQQAGIDIPVALGFDPKGSELYSKLKLLRYWVQNDDTNDALVVKALYHIVSGRYGAANKRDPEKLRLSLKFMEDSIANMKRSLGCYEEE